MPLPARVVEEHISAYGDTATHRPYKGPTSGDDDFWVEGGEHVTVEDGTEIRVRLVKSVDSERLQKAGLSDDAVNRRSDDAVNMIKTVDGPIESGDIVQLRGVEWLCKDVTEHGLHGEPYYWVLGVVEYGG